MRYEEKKTPKTAKRRGESRGLRVHRCAMGENIWRQEDRHVSFRLKLKSFIGLTNCKKMSKDVKETIIMFHLCCEVSVPGPRAGVRVHVSAWFTWTQTVWHQKILQTKCVKKNKQRWQLVRQSYRTNDSYADCYFGWTFWTRSSCLRFEKVMVWKLQIYQHYSVIYAICSWESARIEDCVQCKVTTIN